MAEVNAGTPSRRQAATIAPQRNHQRNQTTAAWKISWKQAAVFVWLTFSVALAIWWLIFGLHQIDRVQQFMGPAPEAFAEEFARQHRMLVLEGVTLVVLLLVGGTALLYYITTEIRRTQRVREFFAAFTHDLKTSLASLRLQAESLEEDLKNSAQERLVRRLVKDTVRIELQLENSLLLASPSDNSRFLIESIRVADLFQSMQHQWPDLTIDVLGEITVEADRRALESVIKNILQNSVVHGRASKVSVTLSSGDGLKAIDTMGAIGASGAGGSHDLKCKIRIDDNGRGFKGERSKLGTMFERHSSTSGSGLGLYLASELLKRFYGKISFPETAGKTGFSVEIELPLGQKEQL